MTSSISLGANISSLRAQRELTRSSEALSNTFQRLSSGQRINRASDDAAGIAIAESLKSDTRVFSQGIRNLNDGISALSVAEGALSELSLLTQRQKELAEQAANGVYSLKQRRSLDAEARALTDEYNRIVESASFNGIKLLEGGTTDLRVQGGIGVEGGIQVGIGTALARTVGTGTFQAMVSYGSTSYGELVSGDFNEDGAVDIYATSTVNALFLGNGNGSFRSPVTFAGSSGGSTAGFATVAVDFNDDGNLDIVHEKGTEIAIVLGNGNGTFQAARTYVTQFAGPQSDVSVADIDGDGNLDVASTDYTSGTGTLRVFLGNSDGSLKASVSYAALGTDSRDVELHDFDGNGTIDAFVVDNAANQYTILSGNGDGTFKSPRAYSLPAGLSPTELTATDFNSDGNLDIYIAGYSTARILISNGDGTFKAAQSISYPSGGLQNNAVGDYNNDGIQDIFVMDSAVAVDGFFYQGNGDGTFKGRVTAAAAFAGGGGRLAVDLNYDGVLELVVGGSSLGVYSPNTGQSAKIAYLDLLSAEGARTALNTTDATLLRINQELGRIGANQSRLTTSVRNLGVVTTNYISAESRIRDTDVAQAGADLVRSQMLQQASSAVLAQANQQPSLVLQLLSG